MRVGFASWSCSTRASRGLALALALLAGSRSALAEASSAAAAGNGFLLSRARQLGIARSPAWLRILHFRPEGAHEQVSQVDGKQFFLAANGARDAEAELAATLNAFLQPLVRGNEDTHALCRFPARRRLLDESLHFQGAMHEPACPALSRFLTELDPEAVSVVYAANYLDNPASAFGHTFLRLKKRRTGAPAVADDDYDHGVEYTAKTDTENPLWFAFKGLTGLFPGVFRFHPFSSKIHEYANAEARDLWLYDLSLTQSEVDLLTLHLWELSGTELDYFYLTKNCSYHALATLEAALPRIDLVAHLNFVVLPRDTVKALFTVPGFVREFSYRPSLRSQYRAQVAQLGAHQQDMVQRLTLDPNLPLPSEFSLVERVRTLDAAGLVLDARFAQSLDSSPDPRVAAARVHLARRRALLSTSIPLPARTLAPIDKAPQRAHGSMRVTLGTGLTTQYASSFQTIGYRLALHDLADPADGEAELSQLQFLDTRLRYDLGQRSFTLDRLTFAELVALNPITRYERALSWRGRAFGMRLHDAACSDCFAHGLEIALGGTLASENERFAVFLMADSYVAFSGRLDGIGGSFVRLGVGPLAGMRARPWRRTIGLFTANWAYLPGQALKTTYDVRAALRTELGQNAALGFEAALQPSSIEGQLASYLYF